MIYYSKPPFISAVCTQSKTAAFLLCTALFQNNFPTNKVPALLPFTISYKVSGAFPFVIIVSIPCAVANAAARSFVFMPPVPRLEPAPPARAYTVSSIFSILFISFAFGYSRGSASYKPFISDKITNCFALHKTATTAESICLLRNLSHYKSKKGRERNGTETRTRYNR